MAEIDRMRTREEKVVQVAAPTVAENSVSKPEETGRPSIAVLPFANMSGDTEQEYFADGMVEEIITGLSRIRWLDVIARNSSFVYKGKAVDIREVGRTLAVRYVLEGSVRKGGDKLRITGQLIEADSGKHLWADKFDGALADVFDLQDTITAAVVGAIEPSLRQAEIERVKRKRPDNLDAYDLYLRALAQVHDRSATGYAAALGLIREALALAPDFIQAHGLAAQIHWSAYQWRGAQPADRDAALVHARTVQLLHADDAESLAQAAIALLIAGEDADSPFALLEQAVALNPNSAAVQAVAAQMNAYRGDWAAAQRHAERALLLSPLDPQRFPALGVSARAKLALGNVEGALADSRRALQVNPRLVPGHLIQIACLMRLGLTDDARRTVGSLLAHHPALRMSALPYLRQNADLIPDLRAAGLPE